MIKDYYSEVDAEIEAILNTNRAAALEAGLFFMTQRIAIDNNEPRPNTAAEHAAAVTKFKAAFPQFSDEQMMHFVVLTYFDSAENELFKWLAAIEADSTIDIENLEIEEKKDEKKKSKEEQLREKNQRRERVNVSGSYQYAMHKLDKLEKDGTISEAVADKYREEIMYLFRTHKAYVMNEIFKNSVHKKRKKEFEEYSKERIEEADAMLGVALTGIAYDGNSVGIALSTALTGGFTDNVSNKNDKNFNMN